jgi:CheY-like chemotaxis protein
MGTDTTLLLTVGSFVASMIMNKAADVAIEEAGRRLFAYIRTIVSADPGSRDGVQFRPGPAPPPDLEAEAESAYATFPVMRRVELVRPVLEGARMLWVDDNPENSLYERAMFKSMGISIELATSTSAALAALQRGAFDVLVSDMERGWNPRAGLQLVEGLGDLGNNPGVVFYIARLDRSRGTPAGAFGITNRPDELIHYVLDVLERERI